MKYIIITNNKKVFNFYKETNEVIYLRDSNFIDVLEKTKDRIDVGHKLLSDPIMSNISDSKNPYKSIAISYDAGHKNKDKSGIFINEAIKVGKKIKEYNNVIGEKLLSNEELKEYRYIDLNLIREWVSEF